MQREGTVNAASRPTVDAPTANALGQIGQSKLLALLLLFVTCALTLIPIGQIELFDRREEHIAADAVDTLTQKHWLVADDHGHPRLKKPPLARWLAAVSIAVLGRTEFAVRLPFALACIATTVLVWHWGGRLGGPDAGLAAGFCFVTNFLVISEAWVASAESLMMFCISWSLLCFWSVAKHAVSESCINAKTVFASGILLGLGTLAKGPVAMLLFAFAVGGYVAIANRRAWRPIARPRFWAPALGLPAGWGIAVLLQYPAAWEVWRHEMLHKVVGPDRRSLLLPKFLPMAAPWVAVALGGVCLPALWRRTRINLEVFAEPTGNGRCPLAETATSTGWSELGGLWLIWSWCVGNLAMFSLWSGAREPYYLACMPAVAILCGLAWSEAHDLHVQWPLTWTPVAQLVICGAIVAAWPIAAWRESRSVFELSIAASLVCMVAFVVFWRRSNGPIRIVLLAVPMAVGILGVLPEAIERCGRLSHKEFCQKAAIEIQQTGVEVGFLNDLPQSETDYVDAPDVTESIWFYLPTPPRLVGTTHDLAIQLQQAGQCDSTKDAFSLLIVSPRQHSALMRDSRFHVQLLIDEARFDHWDTRLVAVRQRSSSPR